MTERMKHIYTCWFDINTERDEMKAKRHNKTLNGFEVQQYTEDERKGLGKLVMVKTFHGPRATS